MSERMWGSCSTRITYLLYALCLMLGDVDADFTYVPTVCCVQVNKTGSIEEFDYIIRVSKLE